MQYIGTVSSSRGLKGEIVLKDVPENINTIIGGTKILIGYSAKFSQEYTLDYFTKSNRKSFVKLGEINSEKDIMELKEKGMFTDTENIIKEENQDLCDDIVGVKIIDDKSGQEIGIVTELWYVRGSNDVWLVKTPNGELPIPVTCEVIVSKNLAESIVRINLIDGLIDLLDAGS